MTVAIQDGWVHGTLRGPGGHEFTVEHLECPRSGGRPYKRLTKARPNLLLHTTEGGFAGALQSLRSKFSASQWLVGENRLAQLRPIWAQGAALRADAGYDGNPYAMQVEIVGFSQLKLWLPVPSSLDPLAALTAWLDASHMIQPLARPKEWSDVLDRTPAAVQTYYRRLAALFPDFPGCFGHVDVRGNEHWDPGSFDYPRFFALVRSIQAQEDIVDQATFDKMHAASHGVDAGRLKEIADGGIAAMEAAKDPAYAPGDPNRAALAAAIHAAQSKAAPLPASHSHQTGPPIPSK